MLKEEIRLSTKGQWRAATSGFVAVIRQSLVQLDLLSMKVKLVGRTFKVTKSAKQPFDNFCAYVSRMMRNSGRANNR